MPRDFTLEPHKTSELTISNLAMLHLFCQCWVPCFFAQSREFQFEFGQFLVRETLKVDHGVLGATNCPDYFIEFYLECEAVPVLAVLNDENHQERAYRCASVDNHLPGFGTTEVWSGDAPYQDG